MVRKQYFLLTLAMITLAGCATPGSPAYRESNWTTPLAALGITATPERLDRTQDWTVRQVVYDAGSPQGTAPVEGIDPPDAVVLADLEGPGCVLRLWAARPAGVLHLYVDSGAEPILVAALADVVHGRIKPFQSIGGGTDESAFTAVPIPYRESCRLVLTGTAKPQEVQVTYATFAPETPINSFRPRLGAEDRRYFSRARSVWDRAQAVRFYDRATETYHHTRRPLWPDEDVQVWVMDGPGTITELEMSLSAKDPDILSKVWLAVFWEGEDDPSILAPVGSFFGGATQHGPDYGDPAIGQAGGRMWCRLPMPFHQRAQIRMVNRSQDKVDFSYGVVWRRGDGGDGHHLHASHHEGAAQAGQPLEALRVSGGGKFVGGVLQVSGVEPASAGGKAVVVADGTNAYGPAPLRSFFGGTNPIPTVGSVGFTARRIAITDAAPFSSDLAVIYDISPQGPVTLSSTVFWYQKN